MAIACYDRSSSFLIMLAALAVAGCNRTAGTEKSKEAPRVTVSHPVVRTLTDEDDYNGWLEAYKTVEVRSRVRGHIRRVYFNDGDLVKSGQPLFDLDPAPFEAEIRETEAQAKAYEAQKVAAEKDVARYAALLQSGGATKQQLDKAQADADSYDAQILSKKAEVEKHLLDLKYSKITAEISGKIGKAALTEGNLVNAGGSDPLLTTIVAINPIYVDFNIDERAMQRYQEIGARKPDKDRQIPLSEQNIPFSFGLDTEKGYPHQGRLVFADNKYNEGTGTILVRGVAENPDGKLIAGSRVRVRIPVSDKYSATLVPDTAVNTDQDQKYLLLVEEGNIVKRHNVRLGRLLDDGLRVILEPALKANEQIIVEGMELARINYPVEPVPAAVPTDASSAK
jgi:membrane fusion protein, multidrug efflux system